MNIHEYQAKQLFKEYDIPVSEGYVAFNIEDVERIYDEHFNNGKVVLKAQIHSGGRGKVGGILIADNKKDCLQKANSLFGKTLVTKQTGKQGKLVRILYLEKMSIHDGIEYYLSELIDNKVGRCCFIGTMQGGTSIEEVAENDPDAISRMEIDPRIGLVEKDIIEFCHKLQLDEYQDQFIKLVNNIHKLFVARDCSLVEINPLVKGNGKLLCLDAKVSFDSAADFRQPENVLLRDIEEENPLEAKANDAGMSYVSLGGNIGCICNGAGLGMSTMDTINYFGGKPANFLDLGGSVDDLRANKAFKLVIQEEGVKGVIINIFGGIARTNLIAKGICEAIEECDYKGPVVCRIEGNGDEIAKEYINNCKGNIYSAINCSDACQKMIELLGEKQ